MYKELSVLYVDSGTLSTHGLQLLSTIVCIYITINHIVISMISIQEKHQWLCL